MSACAPATVLQLRTGPEASFAPITVDWDLKFTKPYMKAAFEYWRSLCAGRKMPQRRELDPRSMREFLSHVNLVNVVRAADGSVADYVLGLQGQHAVETYGPIVRRNLRQVLPPPIEARWRSCFGVACSAARPARFHSQVCAGGKLWLEAEVLLAPLGNATGEIDSLFAALASWSTETNVLALQNAVS